MSSIKLEDLKIDLKSNKEKLEILEKKLIELTHSLTDKKQTFDEEIVKINEALEKNKGKIISFNVSGQKFRTKINTLNAFPDTMFTKIILNQSLLDKEIIYLDRDPFYFDVILNFLRFKVIDYSRFSLIEKRILLQEAEYFEVKEISREISHIMNNVEIVKFVFNGSYTYKGKTAGTNRFEDLTDKSLMKGICAVSPGNIIFTLNKEVEITSIDIGGYNGNKEIWNVENGAGASISISNDKVSWKTVGSIPNGFGSEIKNVRLVSEKGKFIKFSSTSNYVGIGYLKLNTD